MADETKQIQVLLGPYRDKRLTVLSADADAAVAAHWAVDPFAPVDLDNPHPPLTEEERTAALDAANTWAKAQWDAAQGVGEDTAGGGGGDTTPTGGEQSRDMTPDAPGTYVRRGPGRPPLQR